MQISITVIMLSVVLINDYKLLVNNLIIVVINVLFQITGNNSRNHQLGISFQSFGDEDPPWKFPDNTHEGLPSCPQRNVRHHLTVEEQDVKDNIHRLIFLEVGRLDVKIFTF